MLANILLRLPSNANLSIVYTTRNEFYKTGATCTILSYIIGIKNEMVVTERYYWADVPPNPIISSEPVITSLGCVLIDVLLALDH